MTIEPSNLKEIANLRNQDGQIMEKKQQHWTLKWFKHTIYTPEHEFLDV